MTSQKFYFKNILILTLNSEKKLFEIAISDKFQLDLTYNDQGIGN